MSWWLIFLCYRGYLPPQICRWLILPLAAVWLPASGVEAAHGHWVDHYYDAAGVQCCHVASDCVTQPLRIIGQTKEHATVEIGAQQYVVPQGSVHLSEDTRDYVCWKRGSPWQEEPERSPRCVFIAPGT